jgi:hypothetical protein
MRRIIERVVTVVTTTTWTISWQDDSTQSNLQPDPVANNIPESGAARDTAKHLQNFSSVITTKEADESETEKAIDQSADEPPDHSYSDQSKKGNENHER